MEQHIHDMFYKIIIKIINIKSNSKKHFKDSSYSTEKFANNNNKKEEINNNKNEEYYLNNSNHNSNRNSFFFNYESKHSFKYVKKESLRFIYHI